MNEALSRTAMLIGQEGLSRLRRSRVAVFGLGGVGCYVCEALARSGIGALDLVDKDTVSVSNLNRQLYALRSTVGMNKVDAAAARIRDIDPEIRLTLWPLFYGPDTADRFDFSLYDYIVDAIDTVTGKLMLAVRAREAGVPIISAMGAGNKLDPTAFRVSDIFQTQGDSLARIMRKELRRRGIDRLKVVWSEEPALVPSPEAREAAAAENPGRRDTPGSCAFVPGVAGLILAGEVIRDLAGLG